MGLIAELRQRKLAQWTLGYAASAFAVVQGMDLVATKFGWPESVGRTLIIAAVVGLLATWVLAWHHGERGAQKVPVTELVLLALVLALGVGLVWRFGSGAPASLAAASQASAAGVAPAAPTERKSIAVLPFENLSGDKDNAYFASGMQDMILTKLAAIGDLKVISRTSTEKYASRPDNLKAIGQALGVAALLEGSVQKSGNAVLINVQLIDAESDRHLWAEAYPRTLENVFGVEGEVAQKIADALEARLTSVESASVASMPTRNAAAYEAFLKAEYLAEHARQTQAEEAFLAADAEFRRALGLDPGFALAHAKFALCQLTRHWFTKPLAAPELAAVKATVDRALALAPDLPDAHLALAFYHYWGRREYDAAVAEFERTLQLAPNRFEAISGIAYIARRTGRVPQSVDGFERALRLSPRDPRLLTELGYSFVLLRRYPDAERVLRQSLAIAPADANTQEAMLKATLFGTGDAAAAREIVRASPNWQYQLGGDLLFLLNAHAYPDFFERRFADALQAWNGAPETDEETRQAAQIARLVLRYFADGGKWARSECLPLAEALAAQLAKEPDSLPLLQESSWMAVCLGRNAEALALAQKAVDALPLAKDTYFGAYELVGLAQVATHAGAPGRALEVIRELQAIPAGEVMSATRLRLDPVWDPLRNDPGFQAILAAGDAAPAKASAP